MPSQASRLASRHPPTPTSPTSHPMVFQPSTLPPNTIGWTTCTMAGVATCFPMKPLCRDVQTRQSKVTFCLFNDAYLGDNVTECSVSDMSQSLSDGGAVVPDYWQDYRRPPSSILSLISLSRRRHPSQTTAPLARRHFPLPI